MARKAIAACAAGFLLLLAGIGVPPAAAKTPGLLAPDQARKALLSLKQIGAIPDFGVPMQARKRVCHTAPYLKGSVTYCYYEFLHSNAAFARGVMWPNHVDILSFESPRVARAYIAEMSTSGPTVSLLKASAKTVIRYDTEASISTPIQADGQPGSVAGPTVSLFSAVGSDVVYVACADPAATTSRGLASCARAVARAQKAKLRSAGGGR
jgi:hypothetical protein